MEELTKDIAVILDNILKTALKEGVATLNNLPPLNNDFLSKTKEIKASEYSYYLSILEDYDIAKVIMYFGNEFQVYPIDVKTFNFVNKGGFNFLFNQQQLTVVKENKINDIKFKKLKWDVGISRFQAKTKWWPLIISVVSLAIAIFVLFRNG